MVEITDMIAKYNSGMSYDQIAMAVGKSKKWVLNQLRGMVVPRPKARQPVVYDIIPWSTIAERDAIAVRLYQSGSGSHVISKKLGIDKKTVLRILHERSMVTTRTYHKYDIAQLEADYQSGQSLSIIAQKHDVTEGAIRYHLKKIGCLRSSGDALCHFTTRGQESEVIEMATVKRMSSYDIAEHFGVSPQVVQHFLKKKGLSVGSFTPEWKEAMLRGLRAKQSRLEVAVAKILDECDIKYETQFVIGDFKYDFLICDTNILLEVQGSWWHSKPQRVQRDTFKKKVAEAAGYRLLIVWDYQLTKPEFVKNKVLHAVRPVQFDFSKCAVVTINWIDAVGFIDTYHYQGRGRPGITIGAFCGDKLIAVTVISSCMRLESEVKQGCVTYELGRLVIDPKYQAHNFGSWFLRRAIKLFKIAKPAVKRLIAFADPTFGHCGGVYRASNWVYDGLSVASYWYYHRRKNMIYHKKTIWNNAKKFGISESEFATQKHLIRVNGQKKIRYLLDIR